MRFTEQSTPRYVYGAYGSNMDPTRFDKYIAGSDAGEHGAHRGSSDKTPTTVVGVRTIGAQLYFAGHSQRWGAATAFLSFLNPDIEAKAYLQTYSVSEQQMTDLARQEGGVPSETMVNIPLRGGSVEFASESRYGCLNTTDTGIVMLTTNKDLPPGIPSEPYLRPMVQGLVAAGISESEVVEYLDVAGLRLDGPQESIYQSLIRKVVTEQS